MPKGAAGLPYRVVVVDGSRKVFPDGGTYVANFYNGDVVRVDRAGEALTLELGE